MSRAGDQDADAVVVPVVALPLGGSGGRGQSGGAENGGRGKGDNELADHSGLSCLGWMRLSHPVCPWVAANSEKFKAIALINFFAMVPE